MKKYFLGNKFNPTNRNRVTTVGVGSGLRNKSAFNPPQASNHHVEVFKQLVLKDLEGVVPKKYVNPRYIQEGIEALENRKNVIIRPAHKGGGGNIRKKHLPLPIVEYALRQ